LYVGLPLGTTNSSIRKPVLSRKEERQAIFPNDAKKKLLMKFYIYL
jgi:hypothetical protein